MPNELLIAQGGSKRSEKREGEGVLINDYSSSPSSGLTSEIPLLLFPFIIAFYCKLIKPHVFPSILPFVAFHPSRIIIIIII